MQVRQLNLEKMILEAAPPPLTVSQSNQREIEA
jgi:hypothetical protein